MGSVNKTQSSDLTPQIGAPGQAGMQKHKIPSALRQIIGPQKIGNRLKMTIEKSAKLNHILISD
jgi:hypothetical protein